MKQAKAPEHLGPEASREWDRIVGPLVEARLYEEIDMAAVALYCHQWGRLVEAIEAVRLTGGPLQVSSEGTPAATLNPWFTIAGEAMASVRAMLAEFFDVDLDGGELGKAPRRRDRIKKAVIRAPEKAVIH